MTRDKKCKKCGDTKPLATGFFLAHTSGGKPHWSTLCRECHSRAASVRQKGRRVVLREQLWRYLLEHPCVDCGERDPRVLQFDHRCQSSKSEAVSQFISRGYSWKRVMKEIDKTDVRCANCHMRRTAEQLGWYATIPEELKRIAA